MERLLEVRAFLDKNDPSKATVWFTLLNNQVFFQPSEHVILSNISTLGLSFLTEELNM